MKISFLLILLFNVSVSWSAKLDLETQNTLIKKLEDVRKESFKDSTVDSAAVTLRLADLYSERARLQAMDQEGKGEQIHQLEIKSDRQKALELYSGVSSKTKNDAVLIQRAHLHSLLGEQAKAVAIFQNIILNSKRNDKTTQALALIGVGDDYFSKGDFKKSQKYFSKALTISSNPRLSYTLYRLAWCSYNQDKTADAIQKMVKLLKSNMKVTDAFSEELSKDLATFYARQGVGTKDIETLSMLSPEKVRQSNLTYLASELERTAKKKDSLLVWSYVREKNISPEDQIEGQIRIVRIQYDVGQKAKTVLEIKKAIALINEKDENDAENQLHQQSLRTIITDWGKAEEREPSEELIQAYKLYTQSFPDLEINYWGGSAALKRKMYNESFQFFKSSCEIAADLNNKKSKNSDELRIERIFEGSLLGMIDSAEASANVNLRQQAYNQYIKLNPKGPKSFEVKYQIAQLAYESNQYDLALEKFTEIAVDRNGPQELRNKSADLALDCAALSGQDEKVEQLTVLLVTNLPARKAEFLKLKRKSILNQVAQRLNDEKSSESELKNKLKKIEATDFSQASKDEKVLAYKQKVLLGHKLKDINVIITASTQILHEKTLTAEEKNNALKEKAWAYEAKFDFSSALECLKAVTVAAEDMPNHLFRIALLTELSKQNPLSAYERFLRIGQDKVQRQHAAHQIVLFAKNKNKEFKKFENILSQNQILWTSAAMLAYEQNPNSNSSEKILNLIKTRGSIPESLLVSRYFDLMDFQKIFNKIGKHKLNTQSTSRLKRSLSERISLLGQLEKISNRSIAKADWTLQFVSLSRLSYENKKLAIEISKFSIPKSLNKAQKDDYRKQLDLKALPFLTQAFEIRKKIDELWSKIETSSFADVLNIASVTTQPGSFLAKKEIEIVRRSALINGQTLKPLKNQSEQKRKMAQEASQLIQKIRIEPFNIDYLEKMKSVQIKLGSAPMVAYLDSRLMNLQKKGGRN